MGVKVKLFKVPAVVKGGIATLDHEKRVAITQEDSQDLVEESFEEKDIVKKAQQVAEFNNVEKTLIESMGEGDYMIDFKIIV